MVTSEYAVPHTFMSPHERTLAALRRQTPDRAPVFCFCSEESPGTSAEFRHFVMTHADVFYTRPLFAGFQCTGQEPLKTDSELDEGWIETCYSFPEGIQFTEVSKKGDTGDYIGYRKHLFENRKDIERVLSVPFLPPEGNPRLDAWLAELHAFAARSQRDAFFRIAFLGPLGTLAGSIGPADFAILALEEQQIVRRYLDVCLERQHAYLDYILPRLRVPVIMNIGGAEYAIPPLMPPSAFTRYIEPYDGPLIRLIHRHGALVYYHSHGKVRQFLPRFIAMGSDGIHPLEPVGATGDCDLAEVKRELGRDICLIGNIQYDDLARATPRDLQRIVRDTLRVGSEGGGFILSPSCTPYHCPMPRAVEENIMTFIETGLRYGS